MKLAESQLKDLINEEIQLMIENGEIDEGWLDRLGARYADAKAGLGAQAKGLGQRVAGAVKGGVAGVKVMSPASKRLSRPALRVKRP